MQCRGDKFPDVIDWTGSVHCSTFSLSSFPLLPCAFSSSLFNLYSGEYVIRIPSHVSMSLTHQQRTNQFFQFFIFFFLLSFFFFRCFFYHEKLMTDFSHVTFRGFAKLFAQLARRIEAIFDELGASRIVLLSFLILSWKIRLQHWYSNEKLEILDYLHFI